MKLYALLNIILCFSGTLVAQTINDASTIELGSKNLTLDQPFLISVVLRDAETRPAVIFPEINGLEKRSKSATSAISTVDGKKVVIQTITQEYFATKPGNYLIPEFTITVSSLKLKSDETMVVFSQSAGTEGTVSARLSPTFDADLEDTGDGIFLSVQTDKKAIYIREGFALRISLYIAENAPVQMEFYRFNEQLQSILKKLRPTNCWEENVGIEEIVKRKVNIKGRRYTEYNMYQARLFPITTEDIVFPSIALQMLVIDNSKAVNVERRVIKSFRSNKVTISVRQLPDHPLRDQVAVGQYNLRESLSAKLVYPGESVRYMFKVEGVGNIAAIPAPTIQTSSTFDIYSPERSQIIKRSYQSVIGEQTFDYFVVPRKDGEFPLGRYFQWVYFNLGKARYDTLRSSKMLTVKGEDYKLANLSLSGSSGLYDNLESLDSSKDSIDYKKILKDTTNGIVILLLIAMVWVFRK
ncbi:BatD family protein [Dyadobacter chenwenxiniae]|uniref:BatD family protein n=1 Tax=Dyadobacter chenwenxiniae TaxID=2906456 RepID=A0A9X1PKN8_9BACT|nr:BatD family protein [Dyadobacter chenwenxiniae]MCF0061969.1 BatD family protein [Dyadobacter chenwenxiniae]UON81781.1 BatD family protein [Dyadobacter chenwenxiniae]